MKKVLLSAFALSLIAFTCPLWAQDDSVDEFLGFDGVILPELKGDEKSTIPDLPELKEVKVQTTKTKLDLPVPNKGQNHSIIPWSTQDPDEWLSIEKWLSEQSFKDKYEDWMIRLRQDELKELVGKILQCRGSCEVFRGVQSAKVQHLSQIKEGDELKVGKDSLAWVYLMDGSLLRLAPETSIAFHEINFSKSEVFFEARLNEGHVYWSPRSKSDFQIELAPETDSKSLPLPIKEANLGFYERKIYQAQNDEGRLREIIALDENAILDQYKALNTLKIENDKKFNLSTRFMLVSPNSTLISQNASFDHLFVPGGKSYFKRRSSGEGEDLQLHLRGYSDFEAKSVIDLEWYGVEANGRSFSPETEVVGHLQIMDLLTKRIKTIELAREIWVKDFTLPIFATLKNARVLAEEHGYTLWGDDLQKRTAFLTEYTRRIETTNLRSIENLLLKIEGSGKTVKREMSEDYYRESLKHYLLGLKSRYDKNNMKVREMTDLQYYVWILTHGKK